MKNALKFLGLIALVAVIGFSFAACGDAEQGPTGPKGDKGDTGQKGDEGPMRPDILLTYIPEESGLLGTTWTRSDSISTIINSDGYTMTFNNTTTYQVISYGKRPDGSHVLTFINSTTPSLLIISGNTLTIGTTTYTKQG
jgi:hypothetical protein